MCCSFVGNKRAKAMSVFTSRASFLVLHCVYLTGLALVHINDSVMIPDCTKGGIQDRTEQNQCHRYV